VKVMRACGKAKEPLLNSSMKTVGSHPATCAFNDPEGHANFMRATAPQGVNSSRYANL